MEMGVRPEAHGSSGGCHGGSKVSDGGRAEGRKFQRVLGDQAKGDRGGSKDERPASPSLEKGRDEPFSRFAGGVDPDARKRLSSWLPGALGGGKEGLETAAKGLTGEQRSDLTALGTSMGLEVPADKREPSGKGGWAGSGQADGAADAKKTLSTLQRRYGEHLLKENTPGLAPTTSYETGRPLEAAKARVFAEFTRGMDQATKEQLATWLPDALDDPKKAPKEPNAEQGAALEKLARAHGLEKKDARLQAVTTAYQRELALSTTGELPSVVDMMLVRHDGKGDGVALELKVKNDDIKARTALYEAAGFGALDRWLPAALAGRGGIPSGDVEAMDLLQRFARNMGFKGGPDTTPEAAFAYLDDSGVIKKALHPGSTDKDKSFLLFGNSFLNSTLRYGAANGVLNQAMIADAAGAAETLLSGGGGGAPRRVLSGDALQTPANDAPRRLDAQAFAAAVLHRTEKPLERQQELMAAAGYINGAGTLAEQKTRLAQSLLAFHVRDKIGTAPMTGRQWGASYADLHPRLASQMDEIAFNTPTSEKMQIVTAHLGVPGDHKFMIDKKRRIKMSNDDLGNVESFDLKKKKSKWYKSVLDIAIPVVGTILSFTPAAPIGVAINVAYGAYKGAQAIKQDDLLGGVLSLAGAVTGGAASYLGSAANVATASAAAARTANTAATVARSVTVANGALNGYRAAKSGDYLAALTSGLSAAGAGGGGRAFQTAAAGISAGRAIESGDYLAAGAGVAGLAGDAAAYKGGSANTQFALQSLEQSLSLANAIDDKHYAGIGSAASGLIQSGHDYQQHREQARPATVTPEAQPGSVPTILPASYQNPNNTPSAATSIAITEGDTLSQIAERHGTSVQALMTANPTITDPGRIRAGQQLTLPEGVKPVGVTRQDKLRDFAEVQGGRPVFPSPRRPDYPDTQPGATHPNGGEKAAGGPLSQRQALNSLADSAFDTSTQVYQREFDQSVGAELSSLNQKIRDIDKKLGEGVDHAPVAYHLKNEKLKLLAQRRNVQAIADNPNAAFDLLNRKNNNPTSELTHLALDVAGLAPGIGDVVDAYHAGLYAAEGRHWEAGMTAAGMAPIAGIGATIGKWGIQLGRAADGAALGAAGRLSDGAREGVEVLRREGPEGLAEVAEKELRYLGKANVETQARIQQLLHDPNVNIGVVARARLNDSLNPLADHLKPDDLVGALRDKHSLPVPHPKKTEVKGKDVFFDHLDEVDNNLRPLKEAREALKRKLAPENNIDDYTASQISSTLEALNDFYRKAEAFRDLK